MLFHAREGIWKVLGAVLLDSLGLLLLDSEGSGRGLEESDILFAYPFFFHILIKMKCSQKNKVCLLPSELLSSHCVLYGAKGLCLRLLITKGGICGRVVSVARMTKILKI